MVTVVSGPAKKQTTCHNCKAVLEYTKLDVTESLERDYGGGGDIVGRISCPCCGVRTVVYSK